MEPVSEIVRHIPPTREFPSLKKNWATEKLDPCH